MIIRRGHQRRFQKFQIRGLLRTVITYGAAISAGEKGQEPQHALHIFQKLQLRGLLPDAKGTRQQRTF